MCLFVNYCHGQEINVTEQPSYFTMPVELEWDGIKVWNDSSICSEMCAQVISV